MGACRCPRQRRSCHQESDASPQWSCRFDATLARVLAERERVALRVESPRSTRTGADARPPPVGVGQHEHAQHMHEALPSDRHRKLGRPREIGLRGLAGSVQLREHHVLVRATLGVPGLHAALERPQPPTPRSVPDSLLPHQHLEQCLGLQWYALATRPASPPAPGQCSGNASSCVRQSRGVTSSDGQVAALHVLARGLPDPRRLASPRGRHGRASSSLPSASSPRASVVLTGRMVRSCEPSRRSIAAPPDGAM